MVNAGGGECTVVVGAGGGDGSDWKAETLASYSFMNEMSKYCMSLDMDISGTCCLGLHMRSFTILTNTLRPDFCWLDILSQRSQGLIVTNVSNETSLKH